MNFEERNSLTGDHRLQEKKLVFLVYLNSVPLSRCPHYLSVLKNI